MESRELMEKLFGDNVPYPGMEVEWECFAGKGRMESGIFRGEIKRITWCSHCGLPTFLAQAHADPPHLVGGEFTIRFSGNEQRWVCGKDAPV